MEQLFRIDILYGVKEIESRVRAVIGGYIGEGRSRTVSLDGVAEPWSEWTPTGVRLVWDSEETKEPKMPRKWWKFWGHR